jgi:hypothetical protein
MTPVDLEKWPRKAIFELYRNFEYPQINVCTDIDVTVALRYLREQSLSKFKTILWAICHVPIRLMSRKDFFPFLTYASVFDIRSLDVNVFLAFYHPKLNFCILTASY